MILMRTISVSVHTVYTHPASVSTVTASTLITTWLGVTIKQ